MAYQRLLLLCLVGLVSYTAGFGGGFPFCHPPWRCPPWTLPSFNYSIRNTLANPIFDSTIKLTIFSFAPMIRYMETACDMNGDFCFSATYYPRPLGYFIDSINGLAGNFELNQTYWRISNSSGPLDVGVSTYIPRPGDNIVFEFVQYNEDDYS